jgi:hypothetical protein
MNRGTKEGGINSPRIFNTVYAQILKRLLVSSFPMDPNKFDPRKVYYLIFADDLVLLRGDLVELEQITNELDVVLSDVGMKINSAKSKWMAYLPRSVNYQALILPPRPAINHAGVFIENVEEFKYLGFLSSFDLTRSKHIKARTVLLSLAARFTGRLLRSLQITNFRSLRAYFLSLVGSQLYSLSMVTFPEIEYDRAIKQFLQECFTLPQSFPMSIAKLFLGIDDLILQAFNARTNFFHRILNGPNSEASLAAMSMDRGFLFNCDIGWNADFQRMVGSLVDFTLLDLSNQTSVAEARSDLRRALSNRRLAHFSSSSSSFVIQIFPNRTIPLSFLQQLTELPHESIRIVLIFFANLFQFTYFRSQNLVCAFCQQELSSTHLFDCQGVTPNLICNWSAFLSDFHSEDFCSGLDRLFLTLRTILTNRFQPSMAAHIDEYFTVTEFQNRRRDSSWQLFRPFSR